MKSNRAKSKKRSREATNNKAVSNNKKNQIILLWPQKSNKLMNKALESNHTAACQQKAREMIEKLKKGWITIKDKKLKKDIKVISFHKWFWQLIPTTRWSESIRTWKTSFRYYRINEVILVKNWTEGS